MMKIELPDQVSNMLLGMLANSKEVGAILQAYAAGKELTGPMKLNGKFTIEVNDPVVENEK